MNAPVCEVPALPEPWAAIDAAVCTLDRARCLLEKRFVRPFFDGEAWPEQREDPACTVVLVTELRPGVRTRSLITTPRPVFSRSERRLFNRGVRAEIARQRRSLH
ncbi:MAG: hypothetical protein KC731_36100 [Myxococcales bacterium]|nr:hypothetical protein [Myxococcales bacterium]